LRSAEHALHKIPQAYIEVVILAEKGRAKVKSISTMIKSTGSTLVGERKSGQPIFGRREFIGCRCRHMAIATPQSAVRLRVPRGVMSPASRSISCWSVSGRKSFIYEI